MEDSDMIVIMNKHRILIIGSGKIGTACAVLLAQTKDYKIYLSDLYKPKILPEVAKNPIEFIINDVNQPNEIINFIKANQIKAIIPCLPFNWLETILFFSYHPYE